MLKNMLDKLLGRKNTGNDSPSSAESRINSNVLNSWYKEKYELAVIQRNLLSIIIIIAIFAIAISVFTIRYIKSTKSVEPFVIEIDKKSGVPTVVDPVNIKVYTGDEVMKRYFVMQYIKAREEYYPSTFDQNYNNVIRVLSSPEVYYGDYRPKFHKSNLNSPYNLYGKHSYRTLSLKSLIFPTNTSVQARISLQVSGGLSVQLDKIVYLEFTFTNIEMNDEERLINPFNFQVTLYRIEDEKI